MSLSALDELQRPEVTADPWPLYRRLLQGPGPVWHARSRCWFVVHHEHVMDLLVDGRLSAVTDHARSKANAPEVMDGWWPVLYATVSFRDGPAHQRARKVLAGPFRPAAVRELDGRVGDLATRLVAGVRPAGRADVIGDLAWPLPLRIMRELLGLDADLHDLRDWSTAWGQVVAAPGHLPTGDITRLAERVDALFTFGRHALSTAAPGTLVHDLAEAFPPDEAPHEALAGLLILLTGGHETTTNLIGNAALDLLTHPQRQRDLAAWPDLLDVAVTEWARLYPPTQYTARRATVDIKVGGRCIEAGQSVVLMLAAACRDPAAFPDPDVFRLDRPASPQTTTFGHGTHACFGAPLARLETRHAVAALLTLGELQPAGEPVWRDNHNLRGLATLPITFDGGTR